ncbi:dihydrodipicolinate synthase family protein [Salirhabdus salicampi]|uniref:dihydrodipicolinate synthase family protein n=1 Tax=Salirhabdus salicampi TaxID=476102 RepID=UPI0020C458FF|nr:dihydrodipicolinate synthase family protein [Salirhabdus salicampi]MCP8616337.1 dihydrodipicolinate synthase family protein [Salirhabdus salicampi]
MAQFKGVYVAIVTPFTDSYEVDYSALKEHVDWLISEKVDGIAPCGSVGEYASLTSEERKQVIETVVNTANGRVPVIVGTGAPTTKEVVEWARFAKSVGASGLMALPPTVYNPTKEEVKAHYKALNSVGLPIIAYNNPYDYKVDLTPDLLAEMSDLDNLIGVKEFSQDVRRVHEILEKTDLEVLVGCDDLALEGAIAGATGWIAGFTNSFPRESVKLFELSVQERVKEALEIYRPMLPLFRYDAKPELVQAIKYSLQLAGKPVGPTRAPRLPLSEEVYNLIKAAHEKAEQTRSLV